MDYSSSDYSAETAGALAGLGFVVFIYLIVIVISIIGMWKAFEKAGKPGWAALIPIYNTYVMIEIVGKPGIWLLWCLLPCVNIIFAVWLINLVSKSYGKDEGFTVGLILLPFIFWPILGFGSAQYVGPAAAEAKNAFNSNNFNNPNDHFNQSPPPSV